MYLDHKNLVWAATISKSQRVMRWWLLLKEFAPNICHISGEENVVADAISCLPLNQENNKYSYSEGDYESYTQNQVQEDVLGYPLDPPHV